MQVVVFCHSEENNDCVKFSSFKGPLLHSFYQIIANKIKVNKKNCNQIHNDERILFFFFLLSIDIL